MNIECHFEQLRVTDVWSFKILNDKNLSVENRPIDTENKAVVGWRKRGGAREELGAKRYKGRESRSVVSETL